MLHILSADVLENILDQLVATHVIALCRCRLVCRWLHRCTLLDKWKKERLVKIMYGETVLSWTFPSLDSASNDAVFESEPLLAGQDHNGPLYWTLVLYPLGNMTHRHLSLYVKPLHVDLAHLSVTMDFGDFRAHPLVVTVTTVVFEKKDVPDWGFREWLPFDAARESVTACVTLSLATRHVSSQAQTSNGA
jgi:hypothetical protein